MEDQIETTTMGDIGTANNDPFLTSGVRTLGFLSLGRHLSEESIPRPASRGVIRALFSLPVPFTPTSQNWSPKDQTQESRDAKRHMILVRSPLWVGTSESSLNM